MQSKGISKADIPKIFFEAMYALVMSCGKLTLGLPTKRGGSSIGDCGSIHSQSKAERNHGRAEYISPAAEHKILLNEIESWELSQSMLEDAMVYYHSMYGHSSTDIPENIFNTREYLCQDPVEVAKRFDIYGMTKEDIPICWIARLGICLQLPPEYAEIDDPNGRVYLHKLKLVRLQMHPGLLYLRDLVRRARSQIPAGENYENSAQRFQEFLEAGDKVQRIDMLLMRLALEGNDNTYKHYVNKLAVKTGKKVTDLAKGQDSAVDDDGKKGKSKLTDFMIFEVCRQVNVNPAVEPHLTGFVATYMLEKEITDREWEWRSPEDQAFFWVNTVIKKAQSEYPFIEELNAKLMFHKEELRTQYERPDNFRDSQGLQFIFKKSGTSDVTAKLSDKRLEYMNRLVIRRVKDLNQIKDYRRKVHLNTQSAVNIKMRSRRHSRSPSKSPENSQKSNQDKQSDTPGKSKMCISIASPTKTMKNFATDFLLKKVEDSKINKENEKDLETRKVINEIYDLLGKDMIVACA